jgi:hypothetical protein
MPAVALAAGALMAGVAPPARAAITVYYHVGVWDAFDGQGDDGAPVCGIGSHNPADGRAFSLRFQIGGDDVTFSAVKPGWTIPDGTHIPVVVQVGLEQPWTQQAVGNGNRVQWTMPRTDMQTFDAEFRRASSMTVTFPAGSEQPWVLSLAGSTAASNAMGRCVTDLAQRAAAAQPAAAPAPAAESTTQPFGTPPAGQAPAAQGSPAPGGPAPVQPVTQDQQNPQPNPPANPPASH